MLTSHHCYDEALGGKCLTELLARNKWSVAPDSFFFFLGGLDTNKTPQSPPRYLGLQDPSELGPLLSKKYQLQPLPM